jgi:prepilin-type N-terminal cleavage/methylation domain-containing protein/prepilin-type processing-associated H-X9-DG protein
MQTPQGRLRSFSLGAFTLIELLVVIGIIVLLAAFAFPAINSAMLSAKSAESLSNLKQTGVLVANYAAENNNRFPNSINWDAFSGKPPGLMFFQRSLAENAGYKYAEPPRSAARPLPEIFYDPCLDGNRLPQHPMGSFGVNVAVLPPGSRGIPVASLRDPSRKVISCSSIESDKHSSGWSFDGKTFADAGYNPKVGPDPRNAGRAAALFADGHVEKLDVKNMDEAKRRALFTLDAAP